MNERRFTEQELLRAVRDAYSHGVASFDLVPHRCALLVIDMQDEFVRPHWTPFWVPAATQQVPRVKRLIDFCRDLEIPVVFTAFAATHQALDRPASGHFMPNRLAEFGPADPAWFRDGTIWHELEPRAGEVVIHKPSYGAFYDTPLQTILRNMDRDTVLICGTLTNYCCGTTARQAYERSFRVVVGSDVCATDDPELQEPELKVLRKGFARVMSADEIMAALQDGISNDAAGTT